MSHTVRLSECCETCTGQRQGMQTLLIKAVEELDKRYYNDAGGVVYQAASDLLERWTQPPDSAGPLEKARAAGHRNAYEYALAKWRS